MAPMLEYARIDCAGADCTMAPAAGSRSAGHSASQLNTNGQAKGQIVHSYLVCSSHERRCTARSAGSVHPSLVECLTQPRNSKITIAIASYDERENVSAQRAGKRDPSAGLPVS